MHDIRDLLNLPPPREPGVYLPTPADIAEACRLIQAGWSEEEERSRRVFRGGQSWSVPEVGEIRTDGPGE